MWSPLKKSPVRNPEGRVIAVLRPPCMGAREDRGLGGHRSRSRILGSEKSP